MSIENGIQDRYNIGTRCVNKDNRKVRISCFMKKSQWPYLKNHTGFERCGKEESEYVCFKGVCGGTLPWDKFIERYKILDQPELYNLYNDCRKEYKMEDFRHEIAGEAVHSYYDEGAWFYPWGVYWGAGCDDFKIGLGNSLEEALQDAENYIRRVKLQKAG